MIVALSFAALGAARQVGEDLYFEISDLHGDPVGANEGGLPTHDVGFSDREGRLLPDVAARKAMREGKVERV